VTKAGGERTGQKPKASKEETAMTTTIPSSVMYPMILPLRHACRDWLVGVRPAVAFELERLGLLRLTRIDGKVYVAADDAGALIELCRPQRESQMGKMEYKDRLKHMIRAALGEIYSSPDFWEEFNQVIAEELAKSKCALNFANSGGQVFVYIGEGEDPANYEFKIDNVEIWAFTAAPFRCAEQVEEAMNVIKGMDAFIGRLQAEKIEKTVAEYHHAATSDDEKPAAL
jgi:hypothetical protein